ncbi:DUF563 domain-containing protein [Balamuthia mandrillaris]
MKESFLHPRGIHKSSPRLRCWMAFPVLLLLLWLLTLDIFSPSPLVFTRNHPKPKSKPSAQQPLDLKAVLETAKEALETIQEERSQLIAHSPLLPLSFPPLLEECNFGREQTFCVNQCDMKCYQQRPVEEEMPIDENEKGWLLLRRNITYPPVVVSYPKFITDEDRKNFLAMAQVQSYLQEHSFEACTRNIGVGRCNKILKSGAYNEAGSLLFSAPIFLHGEVSLLHNVLYSGRPDATFDLSKQCGPRADYHWLQPSLAPSSSQLQNMVVLCGPQTDSFQHWIDRGLSKLVQVWDWVVEDPSIVVLAAGGRQPVVNDLWKRSGINPDRLLDISKAKGARFNQVVFPCVAPHYHPITYQVARQRLGIKEVVPSEQRNKVVYLTRGSTRNGRSVTNDEEVRTALSAFLADRKEELVVFDLSSFKSLDHVIDWFNHNALALVGPHGGAFYNLLYCAAGTLVVEFFPFVRQGAGAKGLRYPEGFWWPSVFSGMNYYQAPVQTDGSGNMIIPIEKMLSILEKELNALSRDNN